MDSTKDAAVGDIAKTSRCLPSLPASEIIAACVEGIADISTRQRVAAAAAAVSPGVCEQIVRLRVHDLASSDEDALLTRENLQRLRARMLGVAWTVAREMRVR